MMLLLWQVLLLCWFVALGVLAAPGAPLPASTGQPPSPILEECTVGFRNTLYGGKASTGLFLAVCEDGTLYAIDAEGAIKWKSAINSSATIGISGALKSQTLVTVTTAKELLVLEMSSGSPKVRLPVASDSEKFVSAITSFGPGDKPVVFVVASSPMPPQCQMRAYDAETWALLGDFSFTQFCPDTPPFVSNNGTVYLWFDSASIFALLPGPPNGTALPLLWQGSCNYHTNTPPQLNPDSSNIALKSGLRASLIIMDASTGALGYFKNSCNLFPPVFNPEGTVIFDVAVGCSYFNISTGLYAYDNTTGEVLWSYHDNSTGWSSPILAGDGKVVVVARGTGELQGFNVKDGTFAWEAHSPIAPATSPCQAQVSDYSTNPWGLGTGNSIYYISTTKKLCRVVL